MADAAPPSEPLLAARNVYKQYGVGAEATRALAGASLELHAGELVAIRGRSGSGKTTFLNLVSGLDEADRGTIHLLGEDLGALSTSERLALRAEGIGFVFQDPGLVPELKLWENVAMSARIRGIGADEARTRARTTLADVGLAGLEDRFPAAISGGEAQRASVARALAKGPQLVLADEPTANLDHDSARRVAGVLRRYVDGTNAACLVVTHDDIMAGKAHRRYHLLDGVMHDEHGDLDAGAPSPAGPGGERPPT